jgi:hypothetical protein
MSFRKIPRGERAWKRNESQGSFSEAKSVEPSLLELLTALKKLSRNETGLIKFSPHSKQAHGKLKSIKKIALSAKKKPLTEWQTIPNDNLVDSIEIVINAYFPENAAVDHCRTIQELSLGQKKLSDNEQKLLSTRLADYTAALEKICPAPDNIIGVLIISQILLTYFLKAKKSAPKTWSTFIFDTPKKIGSIPPDVATSYKTAAVGLLKKAAEVHPLQARTISDQLIELGEHSLAEEIIPAFTSSKKSFPIAIAGDKESSKRESESKDLLQSSYVNNDSKLDPLSFSKTVQPPPSASQLVEISQENNKDSKDEDSKNEAVIIPLLKKSSIKTVATSNFQQDLALQARIRKLFAVSAGSQPDKSGEIILCLEDFENALNEIKYPNTSTLKIRDYFRDICLAFKNTSPPETKGLDIDVVTLDPVVAAAAAEEETTLTDAAYWETINTPLKAIKTLLDSHLKENQFNGLRAVFYTLIGALAGGLIAAGLGAVALTIGGVAAASGAAVLGSYSFFNYRARLFSRKMRLNEQEIGKGQAFVDVVNAEMQKAAPKNNG